MAELTKHVPMRTCIATGVQKPKSEMIRIVKLPSGSEPKHYLVKVDLKGKERGRGASIDMNMDAFLLAVKKGAIERALKLERKLSADEIADLQTQFADAIAEKTFRQGQKKVVYRVTKEELAEKLQA